MLNASAPGKLILFGEHAVVFGEPALSVAIDLRTTVGSSPAGVTTVNGERPRQGRYPYVQAALRHAAGGKDFSIEIRSQIPEASGMGSSAAVTVALLASLFDHDGDPERESIARTAFEVEHEVQGRASPIDTTTVTQGGGILLLKEKRANFLWRIEKGERSWFLHSCRLPSLTLVVGSTGIQAATGPLVAGVKRLFDAREEAREVVRRIGEISLKGLDALRHKHLETAGELMTENHALLNSLGVGHPKLDDLVEASLPHSFGAKLTGAGGGGSMIALTDEPERVRKAIEARGGGALVVSTEPRGVAVEEG